MSKEPINELHWKENVAVKPKGSEFTVCAFDVENVLFWREMKTKPRKQKERNEKKYHTFLVTCLLNIYKFRWYDKCPVSLTKSSDMSGTVTFSDNVVKMCRFSSSNNSSSINNTNVDPTGGQIDRLEATFGVHTAHSKTKTRNRSSTPWGAICFRRFVYEIGVNGVSGNQAAYTQIQVMYAIDWIAVVLRNLRSLVHANRICCCFLRNVVVFSVGAHACLFNHGAIHLMIGS